MRPPLPLSCPKREAAGTARKAKEHAETAGGSSPGPGSLRDARYRPQGHSGTEAEAAPVTKPSAPRPGSQIIMQWDFSASGRVAPASFQVECADGEGSPWQVVGHVAPPARTWTDQACSRGPPIAIVCWRSRARQGAL